MAEVYKNVVPTFFVLHLPDMFFFSPLFLYVAGLSINLQFPNFI
jgi:hypothetical protein